MQVIGHRGAAALAPENTWAGFDLALELGVDALETDVRATSDGELVLLHDATLDRTTDGYGPVHQVPWAAVSALDAGGWFAAGYAGARVPLLRATLGRYGGRTYLAIEIKQPGIEGQVLDVVADAGLLERVTFTAFEFEIASWVKAAAARLYPQGARVGYLARDTSPETVARVLDAGLDQFCPPADALTPEAVARCKELGLEVRAWGVRNVELMQRAIDAGVDGMTVDFPHLLLEALGRPVGRTLP